MRRLYLLGCVAWPAFLIPDVLPIVIAGNTRHVGWVIALRAFGECVALPAYAAFRYAGEKLSSQSITAIDATVFLLGSLFLAMMGIPYEGIASGFQQGVLIFVLARCVLVPLDWRSALPIPIASVLMYPATLYVAGLFHPAIAAQWGSRHDLSLFFHHFLFNVAGAGVGIFGSHLIYATKRELTEMRKLGNYRLKLRIGGGGMGEVWLARQVSLDREIALKVMRDQSSRSAEAIRRFQREARAASQLKHPNTIRIFDFGASDDGLLYIAMELLDGMDLDALVSSRGVLNAARVIYLARQACGSLGEAHTQGILHRDIKPANLFVAKMGRNFDVLKLLDFGVARVTDPDDAKLTATGKLTGTPAYMSPEICGGDAKVDQRSDIYSLGAVLYFMVTGTELFPSRTFGEVIMMHISRAPERPSARLGAPVPADLERVIMRCLAKQPAERYASVEDLERDLAKCADAAEWTNEKATAWWRAAMLEPRPAGPEDAALSG